jgi:hypothetical protein
MGSTKDALSLLMVKTQASISLIQSQRQQLAAHANRLQQGAQDTQILISTTTRAGLLQNHLLYRNNLQRVETHCKNEQQQLTEKEVDTYRLLRLRYQQSEWIKAKQYARELDTEKRADREETDRYRSLRLR